MSASAAVPLEHVLLLGAALLAVGAFGALRRRNLLFVLVSIEVMLNGAAVAFVGAGARWQQPDGQIFVLFIMTMAAAEVAVGLALLLRIRAVTGSVDTSGLDRLRG